MYYVQTMEYYSVIKRQRANTGYNMDERSQGQNDNYKSVETKSKSVIVHGRGGRYSRGDKNLYNPLQQWSHNSDILETTTYFK